METRELQRLLEEFLADAPHAVVVEDGVALFDLANAKYSISGDRGKCVLHMWSAERNTLRRVLAAEVKREVLRLAVQRFGQAKPSKLEICADRDRRTPTARRASRTRYQALLRRVLERENPGWTIERLTSEIDLERSFGPVYVRGLLRQGSTAFAVFGVNSDETQASVDAALTFAVLWLDHMRERNVRAYVDGLKLFVPPGTSAIVAERMSHLDPSRAKWQLFELDERSLTLAAIDCRDRGNVETRLVHAVDESAARGRFADAIATVRELAPEDPSLESHIASSSEISFRIHGLEFARAEPAFSPGSFRPGVRITFGTGRHETELVDDTREQFASLTRELFRHRHPDAAKNNALYRMAPERWLESLVMRDVAAIDERLDQSCVYSQVPAFSAADRAMIDILTCTRDGRLAVIELKADEDIHLPLQGVDYWSRVLWHHSRGEFQKFGYFPGRSLSPEPPLLYLVAPALHVHPATDTLLRYLAPGIDVQLVGIDEHWRERLKVVFRRRSGARAAHI